MIEKILELRKGGVTRRLHTVPMLGSQTVAQHSWGVAVLLVQLHPNPSLQLLKAALWHDVAEAWVGDVPATAKWRWRPLAHQVAFAELEIEDELGIRVNLTDKEHQWLNGCDILELALTCYDQLRLGNRNFGVILQRCHNYVAEKQSELPPVFGTLCSSLWLKAEREQLLEPGDDL